MVTTSDTICPSGYEVEIRSRYYRAGYMGQQKYLKWIGSGGEEGEQETWWTEVIDRKAGPGLPPSDSQTISFLVPGSLLRHYISLIFTLLYA